MGDTIEFPNELERLLYLGKKYYDQQDYLKSLECFKGHYQEELTLEVNTYLVKISLKLGQIDEALDYVKEFEQDYRNHERLQPIYLDVLLKKRLFLQVEKWFVQLNESHQLKDAFKDTLDKTQDYWTMVDNNEYRHHVSRCQNLVNEEMVQQIKLAKECDYLTKADFIEIVTKRILCDDQVSIFIRNQFIDELVQLKEKSTVEVLTVFNQLVTVNLDDMDRLMPTILTHPLYQKLSHYMEDNYTSQEQMVLGVLKAHLGMMYPCLERCIVNVDDWLQAYLIYLGFDLTLDNRVEERAMHILSSIQHLDTIMMNTMTK